MKKPRMRWKQVAMGVSPWTRGIALPLAANAVEAGSNLAVATFAAHWFGILCSPSYRWGLYAATAIAAEIAANAVKAERRLN